MAAAHPQAWKNPPGWPPDSTADSALTTDPSAFPTATTNGTTLSRCVRTESAPVAASRVLNRANAVAARRCAVREWFHQ